MGCFFWGLIDRPEILGANARLSPMASKQPDHPHPSVFDLPAINARDMCFEQGKPFVRMHEDDSEHVWTEWPNGIVDCRVIATNEAFRRLLDGTVTKIQWDDTAPVPAEYLKPAPVRASDPASELKMDLA